MGSGVHCPLLNCRAKVEQHAVGRLLPRPSAAHLVQLAASISVPLRCFWPSSGPGAPCRCSGDVAAAALNSASGRRSEWRFFSSAAPEEPGEVLIGSTVWVEEDGGRAVTAPELRPQKVRVQLIIRPACRLNFFSRFITLIRSLCLLKCPPATILPLHGSLQLDDCNKLS